MTDDGLPLSIGDEGAPVRDLQERLAALGHEVPRDEHGTYGPATATAVRAFQVARRLTEDGICGRQTWFALVEAGYRLGDRYLYLRAPMVRGDDVVELQRLLSSLGFDPGHVDGIFGPDTEHALKDLQRNLGLTVDGVCGRDVLVELGRLAGRAGGDVAGTRERARMRHARPDLRDRCVAIGDLGGLDALSHAVRRSLVDRGADVVVLTDPDQSAQAGAANQLTSDVYVGLLVCDDDACTIDYYAGAHWSSPGGERLATILIGLLRGVGLSSATEPRGMSVPALRETRMPAVLCHLGPPSLVVERGAELAGLVADALAAWAEAPVEP